MVMQSGFMKIITFILSFLLLNSCIQNQSKENAKSNSIPDSLTIASGKVDSTLSQNYSVDVDTAYIYVNPDSNAKTENYLTKNEWVEIQAKDGEFGFAVQLNDTIRNKGWIKLKDLKHIFFTPPKIGNE